MLGQQSGWLRRCQLLEHDRFEELASLDAIGELSRDEHEEFLRHKETCPKCREIVAETSSVGAAAFLAGAANNEDPAEQMARHRRLRDNIARRLPVAVPAPFISRYKRLMAAGIAAAFILGAGVGGAVGLRKGHGAAVTKSSGEVSPTATVQVLGPSVSESTEALRLRTVLAGLRKDSERAREEVRALQDRLVKSDQHTSELETKLNEVEQQSRKQAQEVSQARNDLSTATMELTQAKDAVNASQATIQSLQYKLADRETRLTEVSASVEREREMLSAGREIRDIMGARDLHIVDVIDRDGKGRAKKAFGRAFYTQGKSLIFYAFDLPAKNTAGGKFVYAAWGSNSNNLNNKAAHSLGIFYNDDQTQHRWAMKFDDPKLLEEIDTVFVTLEPAGRPFAKPTGKPILEAYFGTPPNHP
jgi:anti-sigma factor RsiW